MMAPATSVKTESIVSSSCSSSVSSLSSASGNALTSLSKAELDRLIAENMASVLKSLKKRKHAKKHARIRQAAAAALETAAVEETNTVATGKKQDDEQTKEKETNIQGAKKELNSVGRRVSPRKNNHQAKPASEVAKTEPPNGKENKTINAFQLLMGARRKTIGSNSPGRDADSATELAPEQQSAREVRVKRKLNLQQWAERKGSGKRKLQEEAQGDYIEHQLRKRAKRFKKLIGNMATEENGQEEDEEEEEEKEEVAAAVIRESTPKGRDTPERTENARKQSKPVAAAAAGGSAGRRRSSLSKRSKAHHPGGEERGPERPCTPVEKENTQVIEIENFSNDELLKQLSSPRKKKDSLLGYFAKMPPDVRKKDGTSPPTRKSSSGTAGKADKQPPGGDVVGEESMVGTPPSEISSRPRRSCANRIKDYAAFERFSPEKVEHAKSAAKQGPSTVVTPLKIINVQSPSAMKVVRSPSLRMFCSGDGSTPGAPTGECPTTPKGVKLAPLFARGHRQPPAPPAVDPEKARARQLFLMSGIPEKMRQEMEKRTAYEEHVLNEAPVFPLVSHVTQWKGDSRERAGDLVRQSRIKLRPATQTDSSPGGRGAGAAKSRKIRFGLFTGCSVDDYEAALIRCIERDTLEEPWLDHELPEVENVKEIVGDYKKRYHHFPVFKCYKLFRSIYQDYQLALGEARDGAKSELSVERGHPRSARHRSPSATSPLDESIEIVEPTVHCRNGELLFTEKYKPQNTEQILVNYVPAMMLKRFLSLWQDDGGGGGGGGGSGAPKRCTNFGDGGYFATGDTPNDDDFENSNGSTASSAFGGAADVCNHVVLVGPPGCGKTCHVYAVAQEMNFNVLEINASSRRKGKIILQELLEATQSHQVRQRAERSNSTDGGPLGRPKPGRGVKKGPTGMLNGGFSCLERRPSFSDTNGNGSKKLSLILIEDADIVFEQDDGFLGAINQLVATSKRPIVLTTTNPSCPHMARYMARNNVIRYVAPGIANVAKFLSLLALVERIPLDQYDVGRLYAHNGKDMRKTLNEVQFFIQSGGDLARFQTERDDESCEESNDDGEAECVGVSEGSSKQQQKASKSKPLSISERSQHTTLNQLFMRNQNEEMVLRLPLAFDTLWCNMELVLREARAALQLVPLPASQPPKAETPGASKKKRGNTPKRGRRRETIKHDRTAAAALPPDVVLWEDLSFLYENISRAEAGWGVTQRNRVRYGRDLQDEQQQQQLANEMGHALVEGSWIDWFDRRRMAAHGSGGEGTQKHGNNDSPADGGEGGAKAYDGLRKLEQEQSQTIASYIGLSSVRSRVTACDYEPLLRQICRTERERSSQERRGSRFYHYLRNFACNNGAAGSVNFVNGGASSTTGGSSGLNTDHVDVLSYRFEEQRPPTEPTEAQTLEVEK